MSRLGVFLTSTRPGRVGQPISEWFVQQARKEGSFEEVTQIDLLELNLPHLNEAGHPRGGKYEHPATQAFSALVQAQDAFVFVLPEYNFAMPPALLNALDFLSAEWAYKACGFVSYGGVSAGLRSAQMVRGIAPVLKMMPLPEAVNIPFVSREMTPEGTFRGGEVYERSAQALLQELARWTGALRTLRAPG